MPANEVETVVVNVHKTFGADLAVASLDRTGCR